MVLTRFRVLIAVVLLSLAHLATQGSVFPVGVEPWRLARLGVSAILDLVIGDSLLFFSFVLIGPRIGLLVTMLAPVCGALLAGQFLGEVLRPMEVGAIALTLGGVAWVVAERTEGQTRLASAPAYRRAVLLALGAALAQSIHLVLVKEGLSDGFPAISAALIRMTTAMIVLWSAAAVSRKALPTIRYLRADPRAAGIIAVGTLIGPFMGIWLSMIAVQAERVGVAATLMSLTPVLSMPVMRLVFHESISPRAVLGTLVALSGVAMITVF
jgi:uncharacterized membrane protein